MKLVSLKRRQTTREGEGRRRRSSRFPLDLHPLPLPLPRLPVTFPLLKQVQSLRNREEIFRILSRYVAVTFTGENVSERRGLYEGMEEGGDELDSEEIEGREVGKDLVEERGVYTGQIQRGKERGRKEGTLRMSSEGRSRSWIRGAISSREGGG